MGFLGETKEWQEGTAEQEKTNGFVVGIDQYQGSSERMIGYRKLREAGVYPSPIYALTHSAFEEYQRNGLTEKLRVEILGAFGDIRQKNPNRGVFLGWRTVLSEGRLPPGPRTAAIYNEEAYLGAVKTAWSFAKEQGYAIEEGAEITLVLHPFIHAAEPLMKETPPLQWPGGDVTPLSDGSIQIQATYGPDETVQSYPCDQYLVRLEEREGKISWEIAKKTRTLIARGDKYLEIPIPEEYQEKPALTLDQVLEIAAASKRIPGHRLEFILQPKGIIYRECAPFNVKPEDFFFLEKEAAKPVIVIRSESDVEKIKPPLAITYLPPKLFKERLIPQISKTLAALAKEKNITLVVLSHGSIATQHMVTRFKDFGQSVLFVRDEEFEDGELVWVFRDKEGLPRWRRMNPVPLEDILRMKQAASKAKNLSTLLAEGLLIPQGFYLPDGLFRKQLVSLGLAEALEELGFLSDEALVEKCRKVQEAIRKSVLPEELETQIQEKLNLYPEKRFSVRSAEGHEDRISGQKSALAGIFESFLRIPKEDVSQKILECWVSAFDPEAIRYLRAAGILPSQIEMGVLIHPMIEGRGGVMYTKRDIAIFAGESPRVITSGEEEHPHNITVTRGEERKILEETSPEKRILEKEEVRQLVDLGLRIEKIFGVPQDIEWIIEEETGKIYILQSRPL